MQPYEVENKHVRYVTAAEPTATVLRMQNSVYNDPFYFYPHNFTKHSLLGERLPCLSLVSAKCLHLFEFFECE